MNYALARIAGIQPERTRTACRTKVARNERTHYTPTTMSDLHDVIQDAIYELEQAQDSYGEYDHSAVDEVYYQLKEAVDE